MKVSPVRLINRISAACVILFCFVPSVQVEDIYRAIAIAASIVWIITALSISSGVISKKMWNYLLIAASCVILLFLWRLNISTFDVAFTNVLQPIIMILVALISMFMLEHDPKFLEIMLTVILILICIYCAITIKATIENPYASRIANSDWLEERYEGNEHVGLYGYVNMSVFLVPILLFKIIRKIHINRIADIVSYAALVLMLVMIALAGYMIAIFCTAIGFLMILLFNKISTLRVILLITVCILIWVYQEQLITGAIEFARLIIGDNPVYNDKLDGFLLLYEEGELSDSAWGDRISKYIASFRCILDYPLVGCYFHGVEAGGGHSTIMDTIGRFGWLTAFLYFKIMWDYPRKFVAEVSNRHLLYVVVLLVSVIFGMLDPYCQEMALPWFVVMPYIVYLEKEQLNDMNRRRV